MTWGAYWMFYTCPQCGKKYKYDLEDVQSPTFGFCPECKIEGELTAESKTYPADALEYEEI